MENETWENLDFKKKQNILAFLRLFLWTQKQAHICYATTIDMNRTLSFGRVAYGSFYPNT